MEGPVAHHEDAASIAKMVDGGRKCTTCQVLEDGLQILNTVHCCCRVIDGWRHGTQGNIGQLTDTEGCILNHISLIQDNHTVMHKRGSSILKARRGPNFRNDRLARDEVARTDCQMHTEI